MSYARRARKEDQIGKLRAASAAGICEATTGEWGEPSAKRCARPSDGVFIDDMGRYVVLCRECRIMALGYTAAEKRSMREKFKGAQVNLFGDNSNQKREYNDE
jgi:hypothetical protein